MIQLRFRHFNLYASQNDSRNLSFVKDINVVGNKMTRNGPEMTISKSCIFFNRTDFTTNTKEDSFFDRSLAESGPRNSFVVVVVCHFVCSLLKLKVLISSCSSQYCGCYSTCSTRAKYTTEISWRSKLWYSISADFRATRFVVLISAVKSTFFSKSCQNKMPNEYIF